MGQRVQLKDENNNNVYPVIGKRCVICNNNSDATLGWYKIANISIGGSYGDKYVKLRVTSTHGEQGSGILCIHIRSKGDGTLEFTKIMWESKTYEGIYPNHYRMNAIYGTDKSANLYVYFGKRYYALRFELLSIEERNQNAMTSDSVVTLYSYINVLGGSLPSTGTTVKSWYHYPIGAVYLTYGSEDPNTHFGGTWEKQKGGYLYGCVEGPGNSTGNGTSTGSTALNINQIPQHNHMMADNDAGYYSGWGTRSGWCQMAVNTTNGGRFFTENTRRWTRTHSRNILLSNVGLEANCLIHWSFFVDRKGLIMKLKRLISRYGGGQFLNKLSKKIKLNIYEETRQRGGYII